VSDFDKEYSYNLNVIPLDDEGIDARTEGYSNANWENNVWPKISHIIKNANTLIDVGAGNGRRSKFFSEHVSNVYALDCAQQYENKKYKNIVCKDIPNVEFIDADFLDYDFGNKKFDVVYCEGSFYYMSMVHGPEKVFEVINSIVNDNGYVIILEGNRPDLWTAEDFTEKYDFEFCRVHRTVHWGTSPAANSLRIMGKKNES